MPQRCLLISNETSCFSECNLDKATFVNLLCFFLTSLINIMCAREIPLESSLRYPKGIAPESNYIPSTYKNKKIN